MPPKRVTLVIGAVALASLLIGSVAHPHVSVNPASRFATMESLVERGTWAIDDSSYEPIVVDQIRVDGRTYSSKPPLMPALGAGVYWLLHRVGGLSFRDHEIAVTTALRAALQMLPFGLFLLLLWRFLARWMRHPRARLWMFTSVALSSYVFGYSSKLNNHAPAAFLIFASFACAFAIAHPAEDRPSPGLAHWLGAGAAAGLAVAFDLGAIPMAGAIALYLLARQPARTALWFAPAALVPLAISSAVTAHITGSPLPIYLQPHLYRYPGSYWLAPVGYDALNEPTVVYLAHMTIGHHGWLAMSPVLCTAIPGARILWRRGRRAEVIALGASSLAVATVYLLYTRSYGGACNGMRWLVVTAPAWLLGVAAWLDHSFERPWARRLFIALSAVGAVNATFMIRDLWYPSPWERLFQALGLGSI